MLEFVAGVAQYRLSVKVISRGAGRNAVAAAAYRAGERLHDERLDMTFDYSRRGGVEHSEIMLPGGAPERFADRHTLWNAVEAAERRDDARVAREVQISLPHELTFEQRHELVREYVQKAFVDRGMIADIAMHLPDDEGDGRNFHAHIMLTTRSVDAEGFGLKDRNWNSKELLQDWREEWAEIQNLALRQHLGAEAPQVSHLSLEEQGIDREPTMHLGPTASAIERKGERSERGDLNREIAASNASRAEWLVRRREIEDELVRRGRQFEDTPRGLAYELGKLRLTMEAERDKWAAELRAKVVPAVIRGSDVRHAVTGVARERARQAERDFERTEKRVKSIRERRMQLVSWIRNPQRMIWAKIREVHAIERARHVVADARLAVKVRDDWLRSEAGKAYIANQVHASRSAARIVENEKRTLARKIARADKRIAVVDSVRHKMQIADEMGIKTILRPVNAKHPVQALRALDRNVNAAVGAFPPEARQRAVQAVRAMTLGLSLGR